MSNIFYRKSVNTQLISIQGRNMHDITMEPMRHGLFSRITASVTLILFNFVFILSPTAHALTQDTEQGETIVLHGSPEQKMNQGLLKVQEIAAKKQFKITQRLADEGSLLDDALNLIGLSQLTLEDIGELQTLATLLTEQHVDAIANFDQTETDLLAKNLPEQILQRHRDAVVKYQASYDDMQQKIQAVITADTLQTQQAAMSTLDTLMQGHKLKKSHQKTDPNRLPFGTPDANKTRKPAQTSDELSDLTGISLSPQGTLLAANDISLETLGLAQPGDPVAEDLSETPDIQFTDAITAKSLELGHDPVKIYNWVRNNIEFIPSYGSIQGADYTLQHGKGNAFDTASLLIALLRAANIPARYAYGTVEIPANKVMNWVGGVDVPEAAQQLLGQGGIPNVGLVNGGKITHIRMEQIWVEAWVDYLPSRGAKHNVGDSWIPLDASFKQYEYTAGTDIQTNVPFDAQGLVDSITQNATVNETEGYVQGVNQAEIETALTDYQQQVEEYINNQNPDATVGDILGTQKVIIQNFQTLAAGLPYQLNVRTHNYSELPDSLRHKFRYTLGTEYYGTERNRLITFEQSLPALAGKKLAVSFKPASQADEDLINSYIPEPNPETGQIDPSLLPNTLPGYLINLTAEFSENGEVVHSMAAGTMGSELYETLALWSPNQSWQQAVNHPTVGEYRAIGLDLQGTNAEEANRLKTSIENIKEALESGDETQLASFAPSEIVGELLFSTIYSYFAFNDAQDDIQSKSVGVVNYRMPSYGLFTTNIQTSYWFGLPRNVNFSGLVMDVDHVSSMTTSKDNDHEKLVNYIKGSGYRLSAMEHLVPEQMFSTPDNPAHGISAVKALAIANAEGQKIWTIDQNNLTTALAAINLDSAIETEIKNAVNAGKVATVHEQPVTFEGGTNTGYLLIDPDTGAGAYKISGGANGGFLDYDEAIILSWIGLVAGLSSLPLLAVIIAGGLLLDSYLTFSAGDKYGGGISALSAAAIVLTILGLLSFLSLGPTLVAIFFFGMLISGVNGVFNK